MIVSFVLAVAAGYAVPYAEPHVRRALSAALQTQLRLDGADLRVLTLLGLLAVAAILAWFMDSDTSGFAMALGGALGMFGTRLYAFLRDPDGTNLPEEEQWDGRVRPAGENREQASGLMRTVLSSDPDEDALRAVDAAMKDDGAIPPSSQSPTGEDPEKERT